jgi:hypothetical protein
MTPASIIALVRDVAILAALGFVVYLLINYGKDQVKVADIKAVQVQLQHNTELQAAWQKEQTDADTKRSTDLAAVASTIASHNTPVFVRGPACVGSVPNDPGKAGNPTGGPPSTDQGRGIDYRPLIDQFESKYSTALIDCYAALDKWHMAK